RAAFLRHITTTLELTRVIVHRSRFEEIASELRPVDWITLQGVAFSEELLNSIRNIATATTTIVWISSPDARPPGHPFRTLQVPFTGNTVFLFRCQRGRNRRSLDVTLDEVLIVLFTRIFQDFPIRSECKCPHIFPGLCEYLRVINRDLVGNVLVVGSRKSLNHAQLIAMGMTDRIEIALIIEMA